MPRVTVRVDIDEAELSREFQQIGHSALRSILISGERKAKAYCPVRTGRLRESITHDGPTTTGPFTVTGDLSANTDYAVFVHDGTRPHMIFARRARALHFIWHGEEVFFHHVHHPGTRANPFLARGAEEAVAEHVTR